MSLNKGCRIENNLRDLKTRAQAILREWTLPAAARAEIRRDRRGLPAKDPGLERTIEAAIAWLCRAQAKSSTADGGVARVYSLTEGWSSSYPETTGYIIPTFLTYTEHTGNEEMRDRARRMLEWLVKIQLPCGAFQGGKIDSR